MKRSKSWRSAREKLDRFKEYSLDEAINFLKETSHVKFDETVDLAIRLGVDPRKSDQVVRGSVVLPAGLGKDVKILVFAQGEKAEKQLKYGEALELFQKAAKASKPENLYDLSIIKIASINKKIGNYDKAVEKLQELIKEKPESIHHDYCLFTIGQINFEQKKYNIAIQKFTQLLKEYPHSIYNESARDYIRQIRNRMN